MSALARAHGVVALVRLEPHAFRYGVVDIPVGMTIRESRALRSAGAGRRGRIALRGRLRARRRANTPTGAMALALTASEATHQDRTQRTTQ